jgi:hypothetical protein
MRAIAAIAMLAPVTLVAQALAQCPPPGIHPGYGEWGDAPEGYDAYPALGVAGEFPTCFADVPSPYVFHGAPGPVPPNLWWGSGVDGELDGNAGVCPPPPFEVDECWGPTDGDGGLASPDPVTYDPGNMAVPCAGVPSQPRPLGAVCDLLQLKSGSSPLEANIVSRFPGTGFINVLIDWNQDGRWGGSVDCGGARISEHVIQNLGVPPNYIGPLSGLNPGPIQVGPKAGHVWMRMTITPDQPPVPVPWSGDGCWDLGETEDYLVEIVEDVAAELGDAPEGALAYPTGVNGSFPTCRSVGPAGYIVHWNPGALFFGPSVDTEFDGNAGQCPPAPYDQDECLNDGDAALIRPRSYSLDASGNPIACPGTQATNDLLPCQTATWGADVDIDVTNTSTSTTYVNVLVDWNGDGAWSDMSPAAPCPGSLVPSERVLHDWPVPAGFSGSLSSLVSSQFLVGARTGYVWCRFTISDQLIGPGVDWDGSGSFRDGETEDYLLLVAQDDTGVDDAHPARGLAVAAHPNPASLSTTIHLQLDRDGHAEIAIHDVTGRRVRTVAQRTLSAGGHRILWDGKDDGGAAVPSGVYFVSVESAAGLVAEKLIVTR